MNTEQQPATKQRRLIPVTRWNKYHAWPPIGGLRYLIFHRDKNGFAYCLRWVGRTVLIDEGKFFEWVDMRNECAKDRNSRGVQLELWK
jgi:hypothetical protein